MRSHYDYLIVGGGLYGITCARMLTNNGFSCLLIEKNGYLGGICHTVKKNGIDIHENGIHIFHTSDERTWSFVNKYIKFDYCQLKVCATDGNDIYSLPFNMFTFSKVLGLNSPEEVNEYLSKQKVDGSSNLEERAISIVGKEIYERLIKGYTEKQWGRKSTELDSSIINRLSVRYSYDNNYFDDVYQGVCDYSELSEHIIKGINANGKYCEGSIDYLLNVDFLLDKDKWLSIADKVIYCGAVDELLDYELGELSWRSLKWEHSTYIYNGHNGQGCALLNNSDPSVPYTRSIDHVQINPKNKEFRGETLLTYEYPVAWDKTKERYYPMDDNSLYERYVSLLKEKYPSIALGGRIGLYKYMDMDDTIKAALEYCGGLHNGTKDDDRKFCNIWVVGTNNKDVLLHKNEQYKRKFITNIIPQKQNINELNRFLCEFCCMWYVWKNNIMSDYVCFCHYRRVVNFQDIVFNHLGDDMIQYFHVILVKNLFDETSIGYVESKKLTFPNFLIDDFEEYLNRQTVIPKESIDNYLSKKKGEYICYYNREIFSCRWNVFCELMAFISGYVEYISQKYNLYSYDDWRNHLSERVISFYKAQGKIRAEVFPDYSNELLYQKKENYLKIFDDDEGLNSFCNVWRVYAYLIEDLISVFIGTHKRVHCGKLTV